MKFARVYTIVIGYFLLIQGAITLLFNLLPILNQLFPYLLRFNPMSPLHSTLHLVTGILAMLSLYRFGGRGPIWFSCLFGIFYSTLGLLGPKIHQPLHLHLQNYDHPIHLAIGLGGILAAWISYKKVKSSSA